MADLDDFFSSVDTAVAEAVASEPTEEPSSKRQKTETTVAVAEPVVMKVLSKSVAAPQRAKLPTAPAAPGTSGKLQGYDMSSLHQAHSSVDGAAAFVSQQQTYQYKGGEGDAAKPAGVVQKPTYSDEPVGVAGAPVHAEKKAKRAAPSEEEPSKPSNPAIRSAAGQNWVDNTMADWPANDFRLFVGDLAKEVTDDVLFNAFKKYKSTTRVKVIYDSRTKKPKGYGFVSMMDAGDAARAIREMNDQYIGGRPIKIKKSEWKERDSKEVKKKKLRDDKRKKAWG